MQAVVTVVSEIFMVVLCIFTAPAEQKEILIDVVTERGYSDTLIVRRTDDGFDVYDEMAGKLVKGASLRGTDRSRYIYVWTSKDGKSEVIDLGKAVVEFEKMHLAKAKATNLPLKGGGAIRFNRSGSVIYLTPPGEKRTYIVH